MASGGFVVRPLRGPRALHPAITRTLELAAHRPAWAEPLHRMIERLLVGPVVETFHDPTGG